MLIKHVLSHFTKFVNTWFLAQKSGSQLRCRTMLKMPWNIQETPSKNWKHCSRLKYTVLGSDFEQCLKKHETLRKHQLNMFWGFLRFFLKSGSQHKNPVLGSDVEQCLKKITWSPRKHQLNMFWGFFWEILENPVLGSDFELWSKHVLMLFKIFFKNPVLSTKIRFSAQMSSNAKNTLKHPENTN